LEDFEKPVRDILELDWGNSNRTTEQKVDDFMNMVVGLNDKLGFEHQHRTYAVLVLLLFFIRVVVYMRVHPRIAVLYATIIEMSADFFHFCILFITLFCVLAFLAMWTFGDKVADFGNFWTACYTQFRMLVGEFQMPTGENSGFDITFGFYTIVYFVVVLSLLLNFFLAIVVDSYSNVKDAIVHCKVENNVIWDVLATFSFPVLAFIHGWPQRGTILEKVLRADIDQDFNNDEDQFDLPVRVEDMEKFGIITGKDRAALFFKHYHRICPALDFDHEDKDSTLEHTTILRNQIALDGIRHAVLGEARLPKRGSMSPAKAKAQETKAFAEVTKQFKEVKSQLAKVQGNREKDFRELMEHMETHKSSMLSLASVTDDGDPETIGQWSQDDLGTAFGSSSPSSAVVGAARTPSRSPNFRHQETSLSFRFRADAEQELAAAAADRAEAEHLRNEAAADRDDMKRHLLQLNDELRKSRAQQNRLEELILQQLGGSSQGTPAVVAAAGADSEADLEVEWVPQLTKV